jgi:hypothetical protein
LCGYNKLDRATGGSTTAANMEWAVCAVSVKPLSALAMLAYASQQLLRASIVTQMLTLSITMLWSIYMQEEAFAYCKAVCFDSNQRLAATAKAAAGFARSGKLRVTTAADTAYLSACDQLYRAHAALAKHTRHIAAPAYTHGCSPTNASNVL